MARRIPKSIQLWRRRIRRAAAGSRRGTATSNLQRRNRPATMPAATTNWSNKEQGLLPKATRAVLPLPQPRVPCCWTSCAPLLPWSQLREAHRWESHGIDLHLHASLFFFGWTPIPRPLQSSVDRWESTLCSVCSWLWLSQCLPRACCNA
jgi:hypothetical protein